MARLAAALAAGIVAVMALLVGVMTAIFDTTDGTAPAGAVADIPDRYLHLYIAASRTCPGLGWHVLAAVGKVETDHGRNARRSSAGALGPMQFMPGTWKVYGTDGDGDGRADVLNPADAVFSAAGYLCASGASQNLRRALLTYNHSTAYVNRVTSVAAQYTRAAIGPGPGMGPGGAQGGSANITPRMRHVRDTIRRRLGVPHGVGCYRAVEDGGDHPRGRACDFMLASGGRMPTAAERRRGDAIAAFAQTNARQLGVSYIIWRQRIWNIKRSGEGWRPMASRGSLTQDHFDHVHVSVLP